MREYVLVKSVETSFGGPGVAYLTRYPSQLVDLTLTIILSCFARSVTEKGNITKG